MTSEHNRTIGDDPHLGIRDLSITDVRDGQEVPALNVNATIFQRLLSACSDACSLHVYCSFPAGHKYSQTHCRIL